MLPPAKPLPPHLQAKIDAGMKAAAAKKSGKTESSPAPRSRATLADKKSDSYDIKVQFPRGVALKKAIRHIVTSLVMLGVMYVAWLHVKGRYQGKPANAQNDDVISPMILSNAPTHPEREPVESTFTLDRVSGLADSADLHLVNHQFEVRGYKAFSFVVPARSIHPRLRGNFQTLAKASAPLDLMLMKEQDYQAFADNHPSDVAFSQPNATSGIIDWAMLGTLDRPQKYYLVFANSGQSSAQTLVSAEFTVSFQ